MEPNGATPATTTSDITDIDGEYLIDYIGLSNISIDNYKCRNDAYLIISGGTTTSTDYVVELYNYDSDTCAYNVATNYNVTLGSGSWTFKAGETPVVYTYPVIYDIRGNDVYVDLTRSFQTHEHSYISRFCTYQI